MRNFTKMALMSENTNRGNRTNMGYDMENRNGSYDRGAETGGRATRGTLTWDNTRGAESAYSGGYGSMNGGQMNYPRSEMNEPESRRRRDSRGRFRSEMDHDGRTDMHYPSPMYPPPVYEEYGKPYQIGFSAHGGERKDGLHMIRGGASGHEMKLDEQTAHEWMENLHNEDGSKGPHWTKDQTTQVLKQKNLDCDPLEFWVAINAMYSDYFNVAKKANVNNIDFYVNMAKAFLDDKDAIPGKLAAYYEYIVK